MINKTTFIFLLRLDISGLFTSKEKGMTVTLHVLLPICLWNFDEINSEVCVCFDHPKMGNRNPAVLLKSVR